MSQSLLGRGFRLEVESIVVKVGVMELILGTDPKESLHTTGGGVVSHG